MRNDKDKLMELTVLRGIQKVLFLQLGPLILEASTVGTLEYIDV
jgi:hypothetical protein